MISFFEFTPKAIERFYRRQKDLRHLQCVDFVCWTRENDKLRYFNNTDPRTIRRAPFDSVVRFFSQLFANREIEITVFDNRGYWVVIWRSPPITERKKIITPKKIRENQEKRLIQLQLFYEK